MSSPEPQSDLEGDVNPLPPVICNNPRKKIDPEEVDVTTLTQLPKGHIEKRNTDLQLVAFNYPKPLEPCPRFPLAITWSPDKLFFELNEEPVINKLWIWNLSTRIIYIHCCGLWDDSARLGASWICYPRTRFHLAPGMKSDLFVKATPRQMCPIPYAFAGLQLAAAHKRDHVTGYFEVQLVIKFLKYKAPTFYEG